MKGKTKFQQIQEKRAAGRRRAKIRWDKDRMRRDALAREAMKDPLRAVGKILMRVVIILNECESREIVRRDYHSAAQWKRMKRAAGL